jgi:hypothetical protein
MAGAGIGPNPDRRLTRGDTGSTPISAGALLVSGAVQLAAYPF